MVGLPEEGERRVVHQHAAPQVAPQPRHVLDAGVDVGRDGGGAVQAVLEGAVPRLDRVADGARIVLQAGGEEHQLQGGTRRGWDGRDGRGDVLQVH